MSVIACCQFLEILYKEGSWSYKVTRPWHHLKSRMKEVQAPQTRLDPGSARRIKQIGNGWIPLVKTGSSCPVGSVIGFESGIQVCVCIGRPRKSSTNHSIYSN